MKNLRSFFACRLLIALALHVAGVAHADDLPKQAAAPDDPALGAWALPGYAFRVFHADGSSSNGNGVRDASWWCQSDTKVPRRYTIQFSQEVKFDMEYNPDSKVLAWEKWENGQWKKIPAIRVADLATLSGTSGSSPASAEPKPADANQTVYVSGSCPGGTNFGIGRTTRKLYGAVKTDSATPFDVTVECYWVTWDGKNRAASKFATRQEKISRSQPLNFEESGIWGRTDGGSEGTTRGDVGFAPSFSGEFRGWVIAVRGADGRKLGSAAANPEMLRLVQ